jgi:hypothetical protein
MGTTLGAIVPAYGDPQGPKQLIVFGCAGSDPNGERVMLVARPWYGAATYNDAELEYFDAMGVYWGGGGGSTIITVTTFSATRVSGTYASDISSVIPADAGPDKHVTGTFSVCLQ